MELGSGHLLRGNWSVQMTIWNSLERSLDAGQASYYPEMVAQAERGQFPGSLYAWNATSCRRNAIGSSRNVKPKVRRASVFFAVAEIPCPKWIFR